MTSAQIHTPPETEVPESKRKKKVTIRERRRKEILTPVTPVKASKDNLKSSPSASPPRRQTGGASSSTGPVLPVDTDSDSEGNDASGELEDDATVYHHQDSEPSTEEVLYVDEAYWAHL